MKRPKISFGYSILVILLIWQGMRFVTQAGQGMDMPQNDGYAVSGAALILVAGILLGLKWSKTKPISRKTVKKESDDNFKNLTEYAGSLRKNNKSND